MVNRTECLTTVCKKHGEIGVEEFTQLTCWHPCKCKKKDSVAQPHHKVAKKTANKTEQ